LDLDARPPGEYNKRVAQDSSESVSDQSRTSEVGMVLGKFFCEVLELTGPGDAAQAEVVF